MTQTKKVAEQSSEIDTQKVDGFNRERLLYEAPEVKSFKPLEIMSKYEDRSSELPGF